MSSKDLDLENLQWREGLQRVFYGEKDFVSSNKEKIPLNRQTGEKAFKKSSMKRVLLMSSMERRPWNVLLWREYLERSSIKRRASKNRLEVFYGEKGFQRSFMEKRPSKIVLWKERL